MSGGLDEQRRRQWARLPPAEILAVVTTAPVPQRPPTALDDVVVSTTEHGDVVDWWLDTTATEQPFVFAEFWSWRRRWTSSWSLGPVTNLRALATLADRHEVRFAPSLRLALETMYRAEEADHRVLDAAGAVDGLTAGVAELAERSTDTGFAIVDDSALALHEPDVTPGPPPLRTWAAVDHEVVLTAADDVSVCIDTFGSMWVRHGEPTTSFGPVVDVDLTGDRAVVTSIHGQQLELDTGDARPLAWLAPTTLRWRIGMIPLADVWRPLLAGLPEATTTADGLGRDVWVTSRIIGA